MSFSASTCFVVRAIHVLSQRNFSQVWRTSAQSTRIELPALRRGFANVATQRRIIKMQVSSDNPYKLYYWPMLPGRGEFIRLCLEQASVPYIDVGKEEDGLNVVAKNKNMVKDGCAHFAPPILELPGGKTLSQTPVICTYIAEQHGLMPDGDVAKFSAMQLTQTIHDMVAEVHDVHHPVSSGLTYEDQKSEALRAAEAMVNQRMPKFFDHFEKCLQSYGSADGAFMFGAKVSVVDLSLFQLLKGVEYAFPKAYGSLEGGYPLLMQCRAAVGQLEKVKEYEESGRCQSFNKNGIFRYYAELDLDMSQ